MGRVDRGGNWGGIAINVRVLGRFNAVPTDSLASSGFAQFSAFRASRDKKRKRIFSRNETIYGKK